MCSRKSKSRVRILTGIKKVSVEGSWDREGSLDARWEIRIFIGRQWEFEDF